MASKDLSHINSVPNIVMWSWMRTVLRLCGSELLIFSYIFSQTFDSSHRCYACLIDMEDWFGVTRQTISRNIDRLVEKGFVLIEKGIELEGHEKDMSWKSDGSATEVIEPQSMDVYGLCL